MLWWSSTFSCHSSESLSPLLDSLQLHHTELQMGTTAFVLPWGAAVRATNQELEQTESCFIYQSLQSRRRTTVAGAGGHQPEETLDTYF